MALQPLLNDETMGFLHQCGVRVKIEMGDYSIKQGYVSKLISGGYVLKTKGGHYYDLDERCRFVGEAERKIDIRTPGYLCMKRGECVYKTVKKGGEADGRE